MVMWSDQCPREEVLELAARNFSFAAMEAATVKINEHEEAKSKVRLAQSKESKLQAARLLEKIDEKRNSGSTFFVPADELHNVPGVIKAGASAVSQVAVDARLNSVELRVEAILELVQKIDRRPVPQPAPAPAPALQVNGGAIPRTSGGGDNRRLNVPRTRDRSGSSSSKRGRDDDEAAGPGSGAGEAGGQGSWAERAGRRRPAPATVKGSGKPRAGAGGARAVIVPPVEVYIGNTHHTVTAEMVKEYLVEIAEDMPEEMKLSEPLEVENVVELTKPREDGKEPWCRNWRVQVPHRFREHILRPEAIPEGWTSRRFFPPRPRRPEPTNHVSKRMRPSSGQLAAVQAAAGQAEAAAALPQIGDPDYLPVGHENHRKQ